MGYVYIAITLVLTVYGQLILKWRLNAFDAFPATLSAQVRYMITALLDPYILSSFAAAFLASLTWIAALTKFHLSYAYPFMSLSFIIVLVFSYLLFNDALNIYKVAGAGLVVLGLIIASR